MHVSLICDKRIRVGKVQILANVYLPTLMARAGSAAKATRSTATSRKKRSIVFMTNVPFSEYPIYQVFENLIAINEDALRLEGPPSFLEQSPRNFFSPTIRSRGSMHNTIIDGAH